MKFYYVVVMEGYKTLVNTQCLDVNIANALLKEMKEQYPVPQYVVTREYF